MRKLEKESNLIEQQLMNGTFGANGSITDKLNALYERKAMKTKEKEYISE